MIGQSPLSIHLFASDGRSLRANESWNGLWNLGEGEEPEGTNIFKDEQIRATGLLPYVEESVASLCPVITPPLFYDPERTGREGPSRWLQASIYPVRDESGAAVEMALVIEDMTERKRAGESLQESEARLAEAQRLAHLGSWEWDVTSGEVSWSDEACRIYGHEPGELVPIVDKLLESVHPDDRKPVSEAMNDALYEGEPYDLEHRIVRADGEERLVHCQAEIIFDEKGKPLRMVGTVHDITERKRAEERLEHQAFHDPLTGLANRALFMDRLEHALSRMDRRKEPIAVLFVDLDNFKIVNDSLGHEVGDNLLAEVGERLESCVRPEDTVARLGGDEFVVLLAGIPGLGDASRVAERIIEALKAPFNFKGREVFVGASVGIAPATEPLDEPEELLRNADLALYKAKESGGALYEFFDASMGNEVLRRLELESALRRALERGEFRIYYQPKISISDHEIVSLEALVRWEHPERGLLEPSEFLPVAEETGLIVEIGERVLGEVCRQGLEWQERFVDRPPPRVCTNVSPRQFFEPTWSAKLPKP